MISYKSRLSSVQHSPNKPHKWLKARVLVDARIRYTWVRKLYTGKEDDGVEHGLLHKVMMDLVNDPRREKGYIVIIGICYSTPAFVRDLTQHRFSVCGTAYR